MLLVPQTVVVRALGKDQSEDEGDTQAKERPKRVSAFVYGVTEYIKVGVWSASRTSLRAITGVHSLH